MGFLARATRRGLPGLIGAAALLGVLAATAFAVVKVYSNSFGSRHALKQLAPVDGGKKCERNLSRKHSRMKVELKKAPADCVYKPPVQGDGPRPDYRIQISGKIVKATNKNIREDAYLTASVRVGSGERYELRVFPKTQEFSLRRQPGGAGFPADGTNPDIRKLGKQNKLLLIAQGHDIKAKANGTQLASVDDANATEISGSKLEFGIGNEADSKRDTVGTFSKLVVSVPNP